MSRNNDPCLVTTDYSYQNIMPAERLQQPILQLHPQSFVLAWTSEYVALRIGSR